MERYGGLAKGCWALLALATLLFVAAGSALGAGHTHGLTAAQAKTLLIERALGAHRPPARSLAAQTGSDVPVPCGKPTGVLCLTVAVPLDRAGVFPGTVPIHVEELPAPGTPRGVIFLIAGGPGQGSAHVYGLGDATSVSFLRYLFPGYTLVAYDDRGTGASGLLDCPDLQRAVTADTERAATAACANQIGPARDYYSTFDHAEDLEAVRVALGVDKVGLYGVSYGTKLALAYALAHPDHVDRLLLNSVLPTNEPDPYSANVLRALPATLNAFCSDGGCRGATRNFSSDVIAVANKLGAKPLHGKATRANGQKVPVELGGVDLLALIESADLNPGLAAELPAVIKAARDGNLQPLVRLADLNNTGSAEDSIDLSAGLNAATVCHDGPFPWSPDTPPDQRRAIEQANIAQLPPGTLGPFGPWAAVLGTADTCIGWPSPAGGGLYGSGPLPDVPMLAVSGGFDMRTPTADAAAITALFPQGRLLTVPGVGHDSVDSDFSLCAATAVRTWINAGVVPSACPRPKPLVTDVPRLPAPGVANPSKAASPAKTLSVVSATVREAEATWLTTVGLTGSTEHIPGVFGGYLFGTSGRSFKLVRYAVARGITVSGDVKITKIGPPLVFQGTLTIAGKAAATGVLGLQGDTLSGALGGRIV